MGVLGDDGRDVEDDHTVGLQDLPVFNQQKHQDLHNMTHDLLLRGNGRLEDLKERADAGGLHHELLEIADGFLDGLQDVLGDLGFLGELVDIGAENLP